MQVALKLHQIPAAVWGEDPGLVSLKDFQVPFTFEGEDSPSMLTAEEKEDLLRQQIEISKSMSPFRKR